MRRITIQKMKDNVTREADMSVKHVYNEVVGTAAEVLRVTHPEEQVGASLPTFDSVATILLSARSKGRPPLPKSRDLIILNDRWTKTTDGRDFLVINDGASDKILGFSTVELITCLCRGQTIYVDETFGTAKSRPL